MKWIFLFTALSWQSRDYYRLPADEFLALSEVQQAIDPEDFHADLMNAALYHASNQARKEQDLPLLEHDRALQKSAALQAEAMHRLNFFAHRHPQEKKYRTAALRIAAFSGAYKRSAENIAALHLRHLLEDGTFYLEEQQVVDAQGQPLPFHSYADLAQIVVAQWMASPGHRENLLGAYSHMACASSAPYKRKKRALYQISIVQNLGQHE